MVRLNFSFHWFSHIKSNLVHLCECKFTLKLKSQPVSNYLVISVSTLCCCFTPYIFFCYLKKLILCKQSIYVAFLPQIQAAFSESSLLCGFHCLHEKSAHSVCLENMTEPKILFSFLHSPAVPRNNPTTGISGNLHRMAHWWEVGSSDPALGHNLAAKQIISTFKSYDIKSNHDILK